MANKTLKNKSYKKQMGAGKKKRGTKKKPLSDWNRFTQIVYKKNKNKPGYKFSDALKECGKLKREGKMSSMLKGSE